VIIIALQPNLPRFPKTRNIIKVVEFATKTSIHFLTSIQSMNLLELDNSMKRFLNKIFCGDAITVMPNIPNESVDLVITSPPYNLKNSSGNGMKDGRGGKWKNAALVK
jgi:tRNA1(Val) A37 N6-methylase TrmN6